MRRLILSFQQPEKHRQRFKRVDDGQQGCEGADEEGHGLIHRHSILKDSTRIAGRFGSPLIPYVRLNRCRRRTAADISPTSSWALQHAREGDDRRLIPTGCSAKTTIMMA